MLKNQLFSTCASKQQLKVKKGKVANKRRVYYSMYIFCGYCTRKKTINSQLDKELSSLPINNKNIKKFKKYAHKLSNQVRNLALCNIFQQHLERNKNYLTYLLNKNVFGHYCKNEKANE